MRRRKTLQDRPQEELESLRARVAELEREGLERSRAEEALRQSEKQYRLLVASVPDVTWTRDRDGNTTFISPNVERVFGYKPEEIYRGGRRLWLDQICSDDAETVGKAYESLFSSGRTFDVEYRLRNKEGRWIWIHDRAVATHKKDGKEYAVGVFTDVTERKEAEGALRRSESLLRTVVNTTQDAMISIGQDGLVTLFNPGAEKMFGRKQEEMIGQPLDCLMPEGYRQRHRENVDSYFATGQPSGAIGRVIQQPALRSDGSVFPMEISLSAGRQDDRRFVIAVARDITERKRAEERLRLLSSAVEQTTEGIAVSDLEGRLLFVNTAFADMHGYEPEELIGEHLSVFYKPEQLPAAQAADRELLEKGEFSGEIWHARRDGSTFPTLMHNSLLRDDSGQPAGMIATIQDITERKQAEQALRDSEERSRTMFENAPVGIYRTTPGGQIVNANPALVKMLGYSSFDELAKRNLEEEGFEPGYSRRAFRERLERDGEIVGEEAAWKKRDGSMALVRENARVTRGADGEVLYYDGTIEDITERKRAERRLQESQQMLQLVLDNIPQRIFWKDRHSVYLGCNMNFVRDAGAKSPEDIIGKTDYDLPWKKEESDSFRECDRRIMDSDTPEYRINEPLLQADGKQAWLETNKVPLHDPEGNVVGILGTYEDITERKRAEEALRENEERLALALEATSDGLWDWNIPTGKSYFSPRYYTMLGYEPYEIPASYETWVGLLHPADRTATEKSIQEHVEKKSESFEVEFRLRTKSGGWRWVLSRGKVVQRDATGRPIRMVGTHVDITERRHLEDQLRQAQKMESIGTLTSGIAHDFNNLLTVIMGNASFLLNGTSQESDLYKSLEDIVKASERAGSLIRQLLAFSRKTVLQMRPTDLQRCVDETVALVRRGIDPRVEIRLRSHPALWIIRADQDQMNQVIMNLCVNARDAMPSGGTLSIETGNTVIDQAYCRDNRQARPGEYVELTISDTGAGMDKKTVARIFEPFFTTKRAGVGTGLGLAMVYGIVTQHGGWITVESKPGRGTKFHVFLPRTETPERKKPRQGRKEIPRGSETIMLVDDERLVLDVTRRILTEYGYRTVLAKDGQEAVRMFEDYHQEIDLVVLDLALPKMDGYQVLSAIRRISPRMKVILCTGNMAREAPSEVDQIAAGLPLLSKPVDAEALARTVREVLDG